MRPPRRESHRRSGRPRKAVTRSTAPGFALHPGLPQELRWGFRVLSPRKPAPGPHGTSDAQGPSWRGGRPDTLYSRRRETTVRRAKSPCPEAHFSHSKRDPNQPEDPQSHPSQPTTKATETDTAPGAPSLKPPRARRLTFPGASHAALAEGPPTAAGGLNSLILESNSLRALCAALCTHLLPGLDCRLELHPAHVCPCLQSCAACPRPGQD